MNAWGSCTKIWPSTWPGLAYREILGKQGMARWMHEDLAPRFGQAHDQAWPTEWYWASKAIFERPEAFSQPFHFTDMIPLSWTLGSGVGQETKGRYPQWDDPVQKGDEPIRSRSSQHQSPFPPHQIQHQSPSPSPPWSLPANEQLSHSMEHLYLQQRPHESRSRERQGYTPTEERPRRKQVRFDVGEELGDEPTLSTDLTHFLAEGGGPEWDNATSSPTPEPRDPQQPAHSSACLHGRDQT